MNWYFATAGALAVAVGLIHSALGEVLIFRRMRSHGFIPTDDGRLLGEGHVRILWASWHVLTVFGWCVASVLFWLSLPSSHGRDHSFIELAVVFAMLVGSAIVLIGTKARHPGWAGLLGIAILVWLGRSS